MFQTGRSKRDRFLKWNNVYITFIGFNGPVSDVRQPLAVLAGWIWKKLNATILFGCYYLIDNHFDPWRNYTRRTRGIFA